MGTTPKIGKIPGFPCLHAYRVELDSRLHKIQQISVEIQAQFSRQKSLCSALALGFAVACLAVRGRAGFVGFAHRLPHLVVVSRPWRILQLIMLQAQGEERISTLPKRFPI